jgi:hypothetical protein
MYKKISFLFLICICLIRLNAQEAPTTSGGNASGSEGSVSYSVGQIIYTYNTGTNGSEAQGVQQPFEISVITNISEKKGADISISVFPNPTSNYLILNIDFSNNNEQYYTLIDIKGNIIDSKKIDSKETTIYTNFLEPSTYFLKITENNKEIKTFKIIKKQ